MWGNFLPLRCTLGDLFRSILVSGGKEVPQNTANLEKVMFFKTPNSFFDKQFKTPNSIYPSIIYPCLLPLGRSN